MKVKGEREVAQLCLTLRDPMDRSLPGCSIRGIFQARVLEWVPPPSPPYLVGLPLSCLRLLLADFSLHHQIGGASLILNYLATDTYDKYLLVMIII